MTTTPFQYSEFVQTLNPVAAIHSKKDGLLLLCSDGQTRFLSLWESLMYRVGLLTLQQLDSKYRQDLPTQGS